MVDPQRVQQAKALLGAQPAVDPARVEAARKLLQQPEPEKKKGFLGKVGAFGKDVAKGVAKPFAEMGTTVYNLGSSSVDAVNALKAKIKGNKQAEQQAVASGMQNLYTPRNLPFLGKTQPVTTPKKALTTGVDAGLTVAPVGQANAAFKAGKAGVKEALVQGGKNVAIGASQGYLSDVSRNLQEDKKGAAVFKPGTGTLFGAALPALGAAVGATKAGVGGAKNVLQASRETRIVSNRIGELTNLESKYKDVARQSVKASEKGVDLKTVLANTDLLKNSVDKNGHIDTKAAIAELNDFIKPQEDVISKNLKQEGTKIPLGMVEAKLKAAINDSGLMSGAKKRALQNVKDDMEGLALDADKDGYISLSKLHEAKVDKYANLNYFNPESKRSDKAIAKGLKQLVEEHTKSVDVQSLNKELSGHYALQGYLEKLDGKKVDGAKLGKYFAQTVGAIAGSHFGPLGSIVGAEVGGAIKGAQMSSKFTGSIGKNLEQSPAMKRAIEQGKEKVIELPSQSSMLGNRNTIQSTTKIATKNIESGFTKKSIPSNLYSVAGLGAGFEKDDQGKIKFNPEKAAIGLALVAGGTTLTPQQETVRETINRLGQQLARRPTRANKIAYEAAIKLFHKLGKK